MELELDQIGSCVGSSVHGLMTWNGKSITYWGVFDVNPKKVPLTKLRNHLIKAIDIKSEKPKGAIKVHSFIKDDKLQPKKSDITFSDLRRAYQEGFNDGASATADSIAENPEKL